MGGGGGSFGGGGTLDSHDNILVYVWWVSSWESLSYFKIDTFGGNLGQVSCNNCKVASSHWIRFIEKTYPKLCQQKSDTGISWWFLPQSDSTFQGFQAPRVLMGSTWPYKLVQSFMVFLPMCCRFLFTKHLHVLQQEHATKFASTSWNESNLSGFPKMCRYGSRGQAILRFGVEWGSDVFGVKMLSVANSLGCWWTISRNW